MDKPGLEAMLQKVLQLYASRVLSKRSYAKKGLSLDVMSCKQSDFVVMEMLKLNHLNIRQYLGL